MKQFRNSGQFKMLDLTGVKSGMITALFPSYSKHGCYYWRCICECGKETDVISTRIKKGGTKSCGCLRYKKGTNETHGLKKHPLYSVWANMKQRCYNKTSHNYYLYGARGISVCDRWFNSVENFYNDMVTNYTKGLHLDRIDVNGNYEPENCRWITPTQNNNNKRVNWVVSFDGRTHTPTEWSKELGVKANTIQSRKRKGYSDFEALFGFQK